MAKSYGCFLGAVCFVIRENSSFLTDCYKHRLDKRGVPDDVQPMVLKQLNHYIVEKIADIDRTAKKYAIYGS